MSAGLLDLPGVTEETWQEEAYRRGWGDGLPLVAPTPARVAAALAALDGIDLELGPLPPSARCRLPSTTCTGCWRRPTRARRWSS